MLLKLYKSFLIPIVIWEYFLTGNKRPLIPANITKYRQTSAPSVFFLLKIIVYTNVICIETILQSSLYMWKG